MVKGRIIYVPPVVIDEMESIKGDLGLCKNVEALQKMAGYAKVGREAERMRDRFLFTDRRRRSK